MKRKDRPKEIRICAKCSDLFSACVADVDNDLMGEYSGYVPDWFPEQHYGDYVMLDIDIKTGQITNWQIPTGDQVLSLIDS